MHCVAWSRALACIHLWSRKHRAESGCMMLPVLSGPAMMDIMCSVACTNAPGCTGEYATNKADTAGIEMKWWGYTKGSMVTHQIRLSEGEVRWMRDRQAGLTSKMKKRFPDNWVVLSCQQILQGYQQKWGTREGSDILWWAHGWCWDPSANGWQCCCVTLWLGVCLD